MTVWRKTLMHSLQEKHLFLLERKKKIEKEIEDLEKRLTVLEESRRELINNKNLNKPNRKG